MRLVQSEKLTLHRGRLRKRVLVAVLRFKNVQHESL